MHSWLVVPRTKSVTELPRKQQKQHNHWPLLAAQRPCHAVSENDVPWLSFNSDLLSDNRFLGHNLTCWNMQKRHTWWVRYKSTQCNTDCSSTSECPLYVHGHWIVLSICWLTLWLTAWLLPSLSVASELCKGRNLPTKSQFPGDLLNPVRSSSSEQDRNEVLIRGTNQQNGN